MTGHQLTDTDHGIQQLEAARFREMSPADRLAIVAELNNACEVLAEAGIRMRHPDADDRTIRMRLFALRLGRQSMIDVYGWDPEIEGW